MPRRAREPFFWITPAKSNNNVKEKRDLTLIILRSIIILLKKMFCRR